jgi:hypothetical protein
LADQKKIAEARKLNLPGHVKDTRLLLIVDDFAAFPSVMKGRLLRDVFLNGRNSDINVVLITQNYMLVNDKIRTEADLLFYLPEASDKKLIKVFDDRNGAFPQKEYLVAFHKKATEKPGALVIDYKAGNSNGSPHFNAYHYPTRHGDTFQFKAGSKEFQEWGAAMDKLMEEANIQDSSGDEVEEEEKPAKAKAAGKKKAK